MSTPIRYLALGDSYTIGTGASDEWHNFPSILAHLLAGATRTEVVLTNPAVNGFTTLDLIAKDAPGLRVRGGHRHSQLVRRAGRCAIR